MMAYGRLLPRLIVMVLLVGTLLSVGVAVDVRARPGVAAACTGLPGCNGGPEP
jgi:hypothetical protein